MNQLKNRNWWKDTPVLTYFIVGVNLLVYAWMLFTFSTTESSQALILTGANFRPMIVIFNEWWRLLTAGFIHIGFEHLAMNLLSIYFVGTELERIMGKWRFLMVYLISILGGNVLSFALANSGTLSAGASTGIFGLFTAYIVLGQMYPESAYLKMRAQSFTTLIVLNIVLNIFSGRVDNWGHLGGALFGALITAVIGIKYQSHQISKIQQVLLFGFMIVLFVILIHIGMRQTIY